MQLQFQANRVDADKFELKVQDRTCTVGTPEFEGILARFLAIDLPDEPGTSVKLEFAPGVELLLPARLVSDVIRVMMDAQA